MNPKGKKFISLFLILSLLTLSANLYAKERRGANLIIQKTNGQQVSGELITVKPSSLLLLNTEGKDVSVDIADIKVITIVKKSKVLGGAGLGLLTVLVIGAFGGLVYQDLASGALIGAIYFGIPAVMIGGILGAGAGADKTILIEGMSDSYIQANLDWLRKKARIRDHK